MNMFSGTEIRRGPSAYLGIGLAVMLALPALPTAAAMVAPKEPIHEGTPIRIGFDAPAAARRATLHFRAAGTREYRTLALKRSGERWLTELPAESVLRPAIEYFVTIETKTGALITDPPEFPSYNPYRLVVATAAVPHFAPTNALEPGEALILLLPASTDTKNVRLWIDGRDVTEATKLSKGRAVYLPLERFAEGEHPLRLTGADGRVQSTGAFKVRAQSATATGPQLAAKAYASVAFGAGPMQPGSAVTDDWYGNLHGEGAAKQGNIELFAENVDIDYAHRDSSGLSVATGFTTGGRIGAQSLTFGDMPLLNDIPLLMASPVRRGFHLNLQDKTRSADFFLVGANPVEGFTAAPFSETGGNLFGGTVRQQWPSDPGTIISFSATGATITQQTGIGLVSSQKPIDGLNLGTRLQTHQWGNSFDVQLGLSQVDANLAGSPGTLRSSAYSLALSRPLRSIELHGKLWGYGEGYATVADPALLGDRSGWEVGAAQNGIFSWGLTGGVVRDNVNDTASRPVVESVRTAAQVGLNATQWPALSLALSHADQASRNEPNGFTRTDNVVDSAVFGSSYARDWWDVRLNIGHLWLDDQGTGNIDLSARNYSLSANANSGRLKLGALVSSTEAIEPSQSRDSLLLAGDGTLPLWNDRTSLQGQVVLLQGALDGQFVRIGGNVRMAWILPRETGWRKLLGVDAQLTLTGSRGPALDSATGPTTPNETRLLAGFVVGAPIALAWPEMAP